MSCPSTQKLIRTSLITDTPQSQICWDWLYDSVLARTLPLLLFFRKNVINRRNRKVGENNCTGQKSPCTQKAKSNIINNNGHTSIPNKLRLIIRLCTCSNIINNNRHASIPNKLRLIIWLCTSLKIIENNKTHLQFVFKKNTRLNA